MNELESNTGSIASSEEYPSDALALITGGSGGLGAACANVLRSRGVKTLTVDIASGADLRCDITDEQQVVQLRQQISKDGDIVNILVNSAGVQGPESMVTETEYYHWQHTFRVNVDGAFLMCKHFAPAMLEAGWAVL